MSEASTRKSTKKAFHFPKSPVAAEEPVEAVKPAAKKSAGKPRREKSASSTAAPATPVAEAPVREAASKGKAKRAKKEKVVRDGFTMPKADYERITILKQKCLAAGVAVKKSELLRAGLQLLESASTEHLVAAISALETVKTGRPASDE